MAYLKSAIAILLTLVLLVSPTTISRADGPDTHDVNGSDPVDGHPWDDEVVESDPPGDDPNAPGLTGTIDPPLPPASFAAGSGTRLIARVFGAMFESWLRVTELKATRSKSVKRMR